MLKFCNFMNPQKRNRPRWRGGPPDYMWWLVTITQLISIILHFILAILKMQ